MPSIVGKTVYVLGAGASCHTGAPLLADFLVAARQLRDSGCDLKYGESFDNVFKWVDGLRGSSYYVEFDLDNIEHVFSLAEMERQLGLDGGEQRFSDLRYIIMETLDLRCRGTWSGDRVSPDGTYDLFVQHLKRMNEQRKESLKDGRGHFDSDVVITFNYDVMLDYAMLCRELCPDYVIGSWDDLPEAPIKLLKLHGSTNWAKCCQCKTETEVIEPAAFAPGRRHAPEKGSAITFRMVTRVLAGRECPKCRKTNVLEPEVIPPTWSKKVDELPLATVWKSAVKEIEDAFQIIVIGYSMPPTDTFFQYLMTLGLTRNSNLHRVVIVNKDESAHLRQRYEKIFSRSLKDRGRLKFLTGRTFQEFMPPSGGMRSVGAEIDWYLD